MDFNTGYNFDLDAESELTGLKCDPKEDVAQQQFRDEVDINTLIERFGLGAPMPQNFHLPHIDVSHLPNNYKDMLDFVQSSQQTFEQLPAQLRVRFNHDPQQLFDYLNNDANRAEALQLGLIAQPPEKTRDTLAAPATEPATKKE